MAVTHLNYERFGSILSMKLVFWVRAVTWTVLTVVEIVAVVVPMSVMFHWKYLGLGLGLGWRWGLGSCFPWHRLGIYFAHSNVLVFDSIGF